MIIAPAPVAAFVAAAHPGPGGCPGGGCGVVGGVVGVVVVDVVAEESEHKKALLTATKVLGRRKKKDGRRLYKAVAKPVFLQFACA